PGGRLQHAPGRTDLRSGRRLSRSPAGREGGPATTQRAVLSHPPRGGCSRPFGITAVCTRQERPADLGEGVLVLNAPTTTRPSASATATTSGPAFVCCGELLAPVPSGG